jgi:hypothetical protein
MNHHKRIRVFMLENDLTCRNLAKTLGISKSYVNDVLKGNVRADDIRGRLVSEAGFPAELAAFNPRNTASALARPNVSPLGVDHAGC